MKTHDKGKIWDQQPLCFFKQAHPFNAFMENFTHVHKKNSRNPDERLGTSALTDLKRCKSYLEPCQISKMEFWSLTIFAKNSILDVGQGSENTCGMWIKLMKIKLNACYGAKWEFTK